MGLRSPERWAPSSDGPGKRNVAMLLLPKIRHYVLQHLATNKHRKTKHDRRVMRRMQPAEFGTEAAELQKWVGPPAAQRPSGGASIVLNSDDSVIAARRFERSCPVTPWPASQRVQRAVVVAVAVVAVVAVRTSASTAVEVKRILWSCGLLAASDRLEFGLLILHDCKAEAEALPDAMWAAQLAFPPFLSQFV